MANLDTSTPAITYSLIGGSGGSGGGWATSLGTDGGNNVDADPLFIDPPDAGADGTWGTADDDMGDLRLRSASPAIDVGDNAVIPVGVTTDLHGHPRVLNSVVDMGGEEALHTNPVYMPLILILPVPPQHTISYYMATRDQATITEMGCLQGIQDTLSRYPQNSVVILMFGEPAWDDTSGTRVYGAYDYTPGLGFISPKEIRQEVIWFAEGYLECELDGDSKLTLAIGTSNDGYEITQAPYEFGRQWALMLNALQQDFETQSVHGTLIADQVNAQGASDMELDWNSPDITRAWVDGYLEDNERLLYNFGDAAGCPPAGICNSGWTQEDIRYISRGGGAIPQIYSEAGPEVDTNGEQWYLISLNAVDGGRDPINFRGSLTQHGACQQDPDDPLCTGTNNMPEEGWWQLWSNLRRDSRTEQIPAWSTDIRYSPQ